MGQVRAKNGHREPYKVRWWGVGNEMFGNWQLGYMALSQYVTKHNDFVRQMLAVDPSLKLIGVGAAGDWSKTMLGKTKMDAISEHFYCQERDSVPAHVAQIPNQIRRIADAHRQYRRDGLPPVPVAMDEWNYWYGPELYGELGTRYSWKDGLGIAAGLHEFFRQSDIISMANYAQTVNVIGCIKTSDFSANMETTGLILETYRKYMMGTPVQVVGDARPLDVSAVKNPDGHTYLSIVNPTANTVQLAWKSALAAAKLQGLVRFKADPTAYNSPESPNTIAPESAALAGIAGDGTLPVAPYSVTFYEVK
jgi:alpha-N-arabinofuranosidase